MDFEVPLSKRQTTRRQHLLLGEEVLFAEMPQRQRNWLCPRGVKVISHHWQTPLVDPGTTEPFNRVEDGAVDGRSEENPNPWDRHEESRGIQRLDRNLNV